MKVNVHIPEALYLHEHSEPLFLWMKHINLYYTKHGHVTSNNVSF